jgi:hypothetical protein
MRPAWPGRPELGHLGAGRHGARMRQCCELCEALGAGSSRGQKLIGMAVGQRDVLLCGEHALFALDADVESVDELCELYEFVASVEPSGGEAATAASARRAPQRAAAAAGGTGARPSRSAL